MQEERQEKAVVLAEEILKLAESTLMIKLRFFDMALSRFTLQPKEGLTGTDGKIFYYDPWQVLDRYRADKYDINRLTLHTLIHCIAGHLFPEPNVDERLWTLCCDMAAESVVLEMDVSAEEAPEKSQRQQELRRYTGKNGLMTAKRLYARLKENPPSEPRMKDLEALFHRDDHSLWQYTTVDDAAQADPDAPVVLEEDRVSQGESDENRRFWKYVAERVQTDLETASVKYGAMAGALLQNLRDVNREKRNYADFLRQFAISGESMKLDMDEFDYVYYTYGMQLYKNMPLIEPLEYKDVKKVKDFIVVIDTSAAVKEELVRQFLEKTYAVLKQQETFFTHIDVHFLQYDEDHAECVKITCPEEFDAWLEQMTPHRMGGTDYRPVFLYVDELVRKKQFANLKGLLYFTDGFGPFPVRQPEYPAAFVFLNDELANPHVPVWAIRLVLQSDEI